LKKYFVDQMMDKIRSILSSSSSKKVGPPVPPRPPISAVQKALEKSRILPNNFPPPPAVPIAKGRTVIYTSKINNNHMNGQQHIEHQQASSVCENKCFDTKLNDSSTGLKVIVSTSTAVPKQNGNIAARVHEIPAITPANMRNNNINNKTNNNVGNQHPIMHHKSPVPRPRLKTPPLLPNQEQKRLSTTEHHQKQQQNGNYTRLLMQNQNTPTSHHAECIESEQSGKNDQNCKNNNNKDTTESSRDDELKEKLLNEIFSGRLVEASNVHIRYNANGSNLKRSSSVDVLNDRNSMIVEKQQNDEKLKDRKVMFHEMLISELSEMRRAGNDTDNHHQYHRLSSAKSCSDLSPSGNKQMTIMEMRDDVKVINKNGNTMCLISLEDSGVEDEEKADDCSSSGVGDSWDSCKDMQNR
jgi:hypothetical protein